MVAVLRAQLDFKNLGPSLVFLGIRCGREAITLPKFHREINQIDLVVGRSKACARKHCTYIIHPLPHNVPKGYEEADVRRSLEEVVQKIVENG